MNRLLAAAILALGIHTAAWAQATNAPVQITPPPDADKIKITGDATKGAEIFKLYCLPCHGEKGKGDGVAAAALNPKPRDFTDKQRMSTIPDWEVLKVIKEGGASVGLSPMMTPWGPLLQSDEKIQDVAAYVRSFAK
jgi:mono/diheme cytochrome c family protein